MSDRKTTVIFALFYISVFVFFLWFFISNPPAPYVSSDQSCMNRFGEGYEYRDGYKSPDLCVNNSNGQVRYP